jgi:hypothetical protein
LSDEDMFEPEAAFEPKGYTSVEKVFGPEDFIHDDEAERRAMELGRLKSEAVAIAAWKAEQRATI